MSQPTTIYLRRDLEKADEQAQLRAAVRGWLAAKDAWKKARVFVTYDTLEGFMQFKVAHDRALDHLEAMARRLEGLE